MIDSEICYINPVKLTENVVRITANNASVMTGPGTNTYAVGKEKVAIIDPGPILTEHTDKLIEHFRDKIKWVVVTHTHRDHSPAAQILAEETGALLIGNTIEDDGYQDTSFKSVNELKDDDTIATDVACIKAITTPGHVNNHVCFLVEEDKLLLTGDHMMNGSTVVIVPPAGDMKKYIASLNKLLAYDFDSVAPGHGTTIKNPKKEIIKLIEHRLKRENKVVTALKSHANSSLADLTPIVYDDVDKNLHEWASLSLMAHLIKLKDDGVVYKENSLWRLKTKAL